MKPCGFLCHEHVKNHNQSCRPVRFIVRLKILNQISPKAYMVLTSMAKWASLVVCDSGAESIKYSYFLWERSAAKEGY